MNIYYEVIAGSRSYGLEIESSDVDLCRASDEWNMYGLENEYNLIQVPFEELVLRVAGERNSPYYLQWLFPYEVRSDNELTRYLQENREKIILAEKPYVGDILLHYATGLEEHADTLYEAYPKRMTYSILFYSIYANYAEGMTFANAHDAGTIKNELLQVRRKEMPLDEIGLLMEAQKQRALKVTDFYNCNIDVKFMEEVKNEMWRLKGQ